MRKIVLGLVILAAVAASYIEISPDQVVAAARQQSPAEVLAQATRALQPGTQAQAPQGPPSGAAATVRSGVVEVLMLMCDPYGANYNWVRDVLETYGWNVTTAALIPVVDACYIGGPLTADTLISQVGDVSGFDCVAIMPAPGLGAHVQLMNSPETLALLSQADSLGLLLTAFCGGTRVLAAADVVEGHSVTGASAFQQEYLDAGAIWAGEPVPPVLDGNILTSTRNQTHAWRVCELMRTAIDSLRAARE